MADTNVVLADARDLDPTERDALTASQVRRVPAEPAAITSALDGLGCTPVYLHIDSAQLPGLRFPSGPGPSLTQIEECLTAAYATAAGIACAWLPDRIGDQATPRDNHPARQSTRQLFDSERVPGGLGISMKFPALMLRGPYLRPVGKDSQSVPRTQLRS